MYRNLVKLVVLVVILLFNSQTLQAQSTNASAFGLVVGVARSTLSGKDILKGTEPRIGLVAGLSFSTPIRSHVGLEIDALYTERGFRIPRGIGGLNSDFQVDLRYIDVPVLLTIGGDKTNAISPFVMGGVSVNVNIHCSIKEFSDYSHECVGLTDVGSADVARFDIPIVGGVGIRFPVSTLQMSLEVRYLHGTKDVQERFEGKNRSIAFTLAVRRASVQ